MAASKAGMTPKGLRARPLRSGPGLRHFFTRLGSKRVRAPPASRPPSPNELQLDRAPPRRPRPTGRAGGRLGDGPPDGRDRPRSPSPPLVLGAPAPGLARGAGGRRLSRVHRVAEGNRVRGRYRKPPSPPNMPLTT